MDTTITNLHRAKRGETALSVFVRGSEDGPKASGLMPDDYGAAISELISDLLHLTLLKRHDPGATLARAKSNFNAEQV